MAIERSDRSRGSASCVACTSDSRWLRKTKAPIAPRDGARLIRVVDLFSGCGGLAIGVAEGHRRAGLATSFALAVDSDAAAAAVYRRNINVQEQQVAKVEEVFPGELDARLHRVERALSRRIGDVDLLIGGPPCQGNSDLNNITRRDDPRNELYLAMARAAQVLQPTVILIENVPALRHDHGRVLMRTVSSLAKLGYRCAESVIDAVTLGVPQRRRRHVLIATAAASATPLDTGRCEHERSSAWALRDLLNVTGRNAFDEAASMSRDNRRRARWLFRNNRYDLPNWLRPPCHRDGHSYPSSYGRMHWREPAPTITSGYGSMGQGRYLHALRPRTITPHEAARLQTFPDWFSFGNASRSHIAAMIGNAVPPLFAAALAEHIGRSIVGHAPNSFDHGRIAS